MENPNYPFFKLTLDEKFPRLLVTRRPEIKTPEQNIYGAFLPSGMTRRMLDFLQKTFRLHPCELDIRGDFDAPCPEYFLHRCLAPCVAAICDAATYTESVEIVHLILSGQTELALARIERKIERLAERLEYEQAAEWHSRRLLIGEIAANAKWQINAATMNDVIALSQAENATRVHLTTLRRGKSVGSLSFAVSGEQDDARIIENFIRDFYRFHAPKQIYVPFDFENRKILENDLSANFGRRIKIVAELPERLPPSIAKTQTLAAHSFEHRKNQTADARRALLEEIKNLFGLRSAPRRIECFDVAHLAGQAIVGARVVADAGALLPEDGLVWEFENLSETAALAAAVGERLRLLPAKKGLPDLLIVDGGRPQVAAARRILNEFGLPKLTVVGAVKPPQAHERVSHFLTEKNARVEFDKNSKAMNFLQTLRDQAHRLANETHRELHALVQIFKNNTGAPRVQYLRVPVRYAEHGGNAADLSPIRSLTQAGEVILKTKKKIQKNS